MSILEKTILSLLKKILDSKFDDVPLIERISIIYKNQVRVLEISLTDEFIKKYNQFF